MNNLELVRDRFFDFDHGHVTEAGKVEIYRFLENLSVKINENLYLDVFDGALSDAIRKFPVKTGHVRLFQNNRFFLNKGP